MLSLAFIYLCWTYLSKISASAINCGFPGRPAYGRAVQVADSYSEGQTVSYACDSGYYMVGPIIRRCLPNGSWSGDMPVCDTTLSPIGYTSASESLPLYPSELAADGNKRTCFHSNRGKPRWWRMDMTTNQTVVAVSVTMPLAGAEHRFTIYVIELLDSAGSLTRYHRCATFRGVFPSPAMILVCGDGGRTAVGVTGQVLFIEDNREQLDHFGLCEIEVYVRKDRYECGRPEVPLNGFVVSGDSVAVDYACADGFKLDGSSQRVCLTSGQWSGQQAVCRQISCPKPEPIENGFYRIAGPLAGQTSLASRTVYVCDTGFELVGNGTRVCQSNGEWTGSPPDCRPVDCGPPPISLYFSASFKLLNGTTSYGSLARLICEVDDDPLREMAIVCRDDGLWSQPDGFCAVGRDLIEFQNLPFGAAVASNMSLIVTVSAVTIALVALLLVAVFYRKKILRFKWSSEPSLARRSSWALQALRMTNVQLRRPFRCPTVATITALSKPSAADYIPDCIYEDVENLSFGALTRAIEAEKARKAAAVSAELDAMNRRKQLTNSSSGTPTSEASDLYARVDFALKHRQRLERQQQIECEAVVDDGDDRPEKDRQLSSVEKCFALRKCVSNPGPISSAEWCSDCERIAADSGQRNGVYVLASDLVFGGENERNAGLESGWIAGETTDDGLVYSILRL